MKRLLKVFLGILMIMGILFSISNFFPQTAEAGTRKQKIKPKTFECYDWGTECMWVEPGPDN